MATFITSKPINEFIDINVQTSTGYWKYNHNNTDSSVFDQNDGQQSAEVLNANGEFTIISCLSDGTPSGDVVMLSVIDCEVNSFNGIGLTGLTELYLPNNLLTSFDGTGLSSLTTLDLLSNPLISFNGGDMIGITELSFNNQAITTLQSFDGGNMTGLTHFYGSYGSQIQGQLTGFTGTNLTSLIYLDLSNNPLTSIDVSTHTSLNELYVANNQLTSLDTTGLNYLNYLYVEGNPLINTPSINNSFLAQLASNELTNNWGYGAFYTTGGRTSAGTTDYDYLISNGWEISGADLVITSSRRVGIRRRNP